MSPSFRSASTNCPPVVTRLIWNEPKAHLPNFLSANVRSLLPKIDELALILNHLSIDIAVVSETWLHSGIEGEVLSIPNYNLIRQDRTFGHGGDVRAFVSNSIPTKDGLALQILFTNVYGCGLDRIVFLEKFRASLWVFYIAPPDKPAQEQRDLVNYLIESLDEARNQHPDCSIVLLGDFNNLNISDLLTSHNLNQIISEPTRGSAMLDLVITNMQQFSKSFNFSTGGYI